VDVDRVSRRGALARLGGFAAAALGAGLWKPEDDAEGAGPSAVATGAVSCVLTPEQTEGPYYLPNEKVRRIITEGRPGTPLTLRAKVVNASNCKPIKGAAVDIWHADALGVYSGVQGSSGTFMRGIQKTDAKGFAVFRTVYPGWYMGRTVHIHVKVHIGGNVVHAGQLYFPDTVTDTVYAKSPYSSRPGRDVRNADDAIFRNGGSRSMLGLRKNRAGYIATIAMGVHRS
jgi:protocatechuate 3,4-dioxygenase beta subunit